METSSFFFDLPESLIAQYPPAERGESRLMVLERATGKRQHRMAAELPGLLEKGSLLVFNNSRVRKARLPGTAIGASHNAPGSTVEFLLLNRVDPLTWRVLAPKAKKRKPGSRYTFDGGMEAEMVPGTFLRFDSPVDDSWLDIHGHIPLPPYIRRPDNPADSERYQTVYADPAAGAALGPGASAAAPTAGLHFTGEMFERLKASGIETAFVTLHVGLGTFLPVRVSNIEDHVMHEEVFSISEDAAQKINKAKDEGRKIIAVGTTSVRTLESAWVSGSNSESGGDGKSGGYLGAGEGATKFFIYPGYQFKMIDGLFTNFHTPGSTLLMLVSAFAGYEAIMASYAEAVKEGYRFFSYGDAMLIL
jgi:S-adenosylmethionine:tRNA ribosyltransferase-isomerase